jgi:ribose transport system ATP-binding protein
MAAAMEITKSADGTVPPRRVLASIHSVSKRFAGVQALRDVTLELCAHEVHCLVGENGAGKSTAVKLLSGVYQPDSGEVRIGSAEERIKRPQDALRLGVRTIYQEHTLAPEMTVAENIALGHEPTRGLPFVLARSERNRIAAKVLEELGIGDIDPLERTGYLGIAQQQLVEIAKTVVRGGERVVVMDEPTAPLTLDEIARLFEIIHRVRDRGLCVLYITHRLEEVGEIGDCVTILRDGEVVRRARVGELTHAELIEAMVGRKIENLHPTRNAEVGALTLEIAIDGGSTADIVVRRGEVVAVFGLVGAGRTELVREVIGADKGTAGVKLEGVKVRFRAPGRAFSAGIGFVPEDRKSQGLVPEMGVASNIALSSLGRIAVGPILPPPTIDTLGSEYIEQLGIRTPSSRQPIMFLSGGNQQKSVIARMLASHPRVIILDEPTRGVDVGARTEVYGLINTLCEQGCGILMVTSDLPEAIGMADRIYVLREGRVVGELPASSSQQEIMALAVGARAEDVQGGVDGTT